MHEPHSSGVRTITHFVRVEVVIQMTGNCVYVTEKNKLNLHEKGVLKQTLTFDVNKDFH